MTKAIFFTFLFTLMLVSGAVAQSPAAAPSGPPSASSEAESDWPSIKTLSDKEGFTSLNGRFKVALPGFIQGFRELSPEDTGPNASGEEFDWKFAEGTIAMVVLDYTNAPLVGTADELAVLTGTFKKTLSGTEPAARLVSESETLVNGIPSKNFVHDLGAGRNEVDQFFLVKKRLYWLSAKLKGVEASDVLKILNSFELLSQADVDAEIQRKYEAARPEGLPQTPIVRKLKSDADDDGLKGEVKRVVTASEDLSGADGMQGRRRQSVVDYDNKGMRLQHDFYLSGLPYDITVYGYIDGKRVSTSGAISYDDGPVMSITGDIVETLDPKKKPDPRYQDSYEYKYRNGKLVEMQMFGNDGTKGMLYVYNHSPNRLEELAYDESGQLNQRYLSILDANGNVIEMTDFALARFDQNGDRKCRFTYEFDKVGNWIKKVTSCEVKESGTPTYKLESVTYRTITYY